MSYDAATRARLVGLFVAEAEETVSSLGRIALALRAGAAGAELSEFGRVAHGLKGAAAALGFDGLSTALHDLEALALGIPRADPDAAAERHRRIDEALTILGDGIARMAASGRDGFPSDLLGILLDTVAEPGAAAPRAPAAEGGASPALSGGVFPAGSAAGALPSAEAGSPSPGPDAPAERLSVPAADIDEALRLAALLARSAGQLHEALAREGGLLAPSAQALAASAQRLEGIVSSLRLLPADAALSGLEEEVAELAARLHKRAALALSGRDVLADRRTLQAARGMIRHLVRNAVDHGLEAPERRRAAGKPAAGRLEVDVRASESALRVTVADDGAGFDLGAIRQEMIRRTGDADRIGSLSDEEALLLWAFEGGSTRASATEISGRGLGLSAVARTARAAGGGIELRSTPGAGSRIAFTLPLQVYAVEVLSVTAGGRLFGIPLYAIDRVVHVAAVREAVHDGPTGRTLAVGETILPLESFAAAVGATARDAGRFAVVIRAEAGMAALSVEEIGATVEVVPAGVPGVAYAEALVTGIAQLGDGAILSVVNPRLLLSRARALAVSPPPAAAAPEAAPVAAPRPDALEVVLADDSLATREVLRVLLEEQGFRVRLAADGEEALQRVTERVPDVLVSDLNMPRRDGLSLARELRRRPRTARLPIVLLTSQDDAAMRAAGAEAGADAYLLKSRFNAGVLQETLAGLGVRAPR